MRFRPTEPPRVFEVADGRARLADCGSIALDPDEQVTFTTGSGGEYDVVRKDWGFYATPSLNGRLARFGLRGVLVRNTAGQYFVLLVERGHEAGFEAYVQSERLAITAWMDTAEALAALDPDRP